MIHCFDQFPHVRGQIAVKTQSIRCDGMDETENRRMKRLPLKTEALEDGP